VQQISDVLARKISLTNGLETAKEFCGIVKKPRVITATLTAGAIKACPFSHDAGISRDFNEPMRCSTSMRSVFFWSGGCVDFVESHEVATCRQETKGLLMATFRICMTSLFLRHWLQMKD